MADLAPLYPYVVAFIFGISVGSFLNVVIYRLPMGMSIVWPGSSCPVCGSSIRPFDNIPLLSWMALTGLCRDCGSPISSRYFFVELLTGVITVSIVNHYGVHAHTLIYLALAYGLVTVTFIDIDFQIIPDELSVGGVLLGLVLSPLTPIGLNGAIAGAALGGGLFYLIAVVYPGGMGGGDIKLITAIGAFTGWKLTALTIITASVTGSIVGVIAMILFGKTRKDRIPFGPFLALGGLISLIWGEKMIRLYIDTFVY